MEVFDNTVAIQLLAYSAAAAVLCWTAYSWLKPKPLPYFPHNPVTGILGDIPEIAQTIKSGKTIINYFGVLFDRYGPVVQVCIGRSVSLVVADTAEAERLIAGKNLDLSLNVNQVFSPIIPTGLVSLPTNAVWKHHRRVLGPSMHRRYLSRMTGHISDAAASLVQLWKNKLDIAQNSSFDVETDLRLATMDSIANISIGSSFGCIAQAIKSMSSSPAIAHNVAVITTGEPTPIYRAIRTVLTYVTRASTLPFGSVTIPIYMRFSPTFRRARSLLQTFMLAKIAAAREREDSITRSGELMTDADCILDMLIQQEIREGSEALSTGELLDELLTVFMAGQETTSSALAWFVKYMPRDPEIQRRLRDEVCAVFGKEDGNLSPMDLSILSDAEKMPILEAVTTETLRCSMVAAGISRRLIDDDTIMGRHVPKGFTVLILTGFMGIKESDWGADAKEWRPSRWLREDGSFNRHAGPDGSPFGLGHRSCFGQRLAVIQLKIFIATLSRALFFKPVAPQVDSWESVTVITTQPKKCYISIEGWD